MKQLLRTLPRRCLAIVLLLAACFTTARAADSAASLPELLDLFGMNQEFFGSFVDGRPLSEDERQKVYKLLFRLRDLPPADVQSWAQGESAFRNLSARPETERGKLFHLEGTATQVTPVELDDEQQARYQLQSLFRCDFTAADGTKVEVLARAVPNAWKRNEPIDEPANFRGMFVKRLAADEPNRAGPLLFVTMRVAWQPPTLLGKLGMDVGLLDDVRDQRAIGSDERECFYQMLSAVERSKSGELDRAADAQLAQRRQEQSLGLGKLAGNPQQQAGVRREQKKAAQNVDDVVPLFNDAEAQRGKLFVLEGDARRAIEIKVEDPDIVRRFGIHNYYEIELFTDDSQNNPIVFCVASLPPGMPQGEDIHERVRIAGFFLKTWAYPIRHTSDGLGADGQPLVRQQLAPLLMGRQSQWFPKDNARDALSPIVLAVLLGALVLTIAWLWRQRRGDKKFYRETLGKHEASPDFSKLE